MEKWQGKLAVIAGCSAGIGRSLAKDLVNAGLIVIGLARRVEKIDELKDGLKKAKGKLYSRKCDVSDQDSVSEAFAWILKEFGTLIILINNAGCARYNTAILSDDKNSLPLMKEVIDTNFTGLVQCSQEAFKIMKIHDDYGLIININSVAGHSIPFAKHSRNVYPCTKYAVTACSEVMRQELVNMKNTKIRVASVSPGLVDSEFLVVSGFLKPEDKDSKLLTAALRPEDVSNAILYILSTPPHVNVTEIIIKPIDQQF